MNISFNTPANINPRTGRPYAQKTAKLPMIALDTGKTIYARSFRNRCRQIVAATSADGVWKFGRHEDVGTTWTATHLPTGDFAEGLASLPQCRRDAASGHLLYLIEQQQKARDELRAERTKRGQSR